MRALTHVDNPPACPRLLLATLAQVLKTTQSGYSGFLHDKYTTLPDASDRIVATSVTATWRWVQELRPARCSAQRRLVGRRACWRPGGLATQAWPWAATRVDAGATSRRPALPRSYSRPPASYDAAYGAVKAALCSAFYGPPKGGVFSPSVQFTLYRMGQGALARYADLAPAAGLVALECIRGMLGPACLSQHSLQCMHSGTHRLPWSAMHGEGHRCTALSELGLRAISEPTARPSHTHPRPAACPRWKASF